MNISQEDTILILKNRSKGTVQKGYVINFQTRVGNGVELTVC